MSSWQGLGPHRSPVCYSSSVFLGLSHCFDYLPAVLVSSFVKKMSLSSLAVAVSVTIFGDLILANKITGCVV